MHSAFQLHIIHVAGSRMILQGTDGLSHGEYSTGVMTGTPLLSFFPCHLTALDRSSTLLPWLRSWCPHTHLHPLSPAEWFELGQGLQGGAYSTDWIWIPHETPQQAFLWAPAPAAAYVAVDSITLSHHKCTTLHHIFICLRLFTYLWCKKLFKVPDLVLELPAGYHPSWPKLLHEPLIICLTLPFLPFSPWQLRGSGAVLELGREVLHVWKGEKGDVGSVLCQLWNLPTSLASVS